MRSLVEISTGNSTSGSPLGLLETDAMVSGADMKDRHVEARLESGLSSHFQSEGSRPVNLQPWAFATGKEGP